MSRIMLLAGVHLDRAWPDLGSAFGRVLRDWSREALVKAVEQAREHQASAVVVVGGLMDRSTVLPDTLEFAATVLGSFPGPVVVAPGPTDWIGDGGPYELGGWPPNVHIWTKAAFDAAPLLPNVWGSAWTGPASRAPRPPDDGRDGALRIWVRASLPEGDLPGRDQEPVVSSSVPGRDRLVVVPDLVHQPGEAGGAVLLVDVEEGLADVDTIGLPGQPGALVELDVTGRVTQEEFDADFKVACVGEGPVLLRLAGELAAPILLPGFGGPDVPLDVSVDVSGLRYAVEVPEAADRSTRAEFLRAMALTRGDERERHQTTALGLVALSASATGS